MRACILLTSDSNIALSVASSSSSCWERRTFSMAGRASAMASVASISTVAAKAASSSASAVIAASSLPEEVLHGVGLESTPGASWLLLLASPTAGSFGAEAASPGSPPWAKASFAVRALASSPLLAPAASVSKARRRSSASSSPSTAASAFASSPFCAPDVSASTALRRSAAASVWASLAARAFASSPDRAPVASVPNARRRSWSSPSGPPSTPALACTARARERSPLLAAPVSEAKACCRSSSLMASSSSSSSSSCSGCGPGLAWVSALWRLPLAAPLAKEASTCCRSSPSSRVARASPMAPARFPLRAPVANVSRACRLNCSSLGPRIFSNALARLPLPAPLTRASRACWRKRCALPCAWLALVAQASAPTRLPSAAPRERVPSTCFRKPSSSESCQLASSLLPPGRSLAALFSQPMPLWSACWAKCFAT
mmetsp:Transcript_47498/g.151567  ORF Transcript_47498/g.151567 Transcript_47498/m.151567 type:complete len:432 (+) Transcript_47498:154-1449(+)